MIGNGSKKEKQMERPNADAWAPDDLWEVTKIRKGAPV
jgi:hypothetical protein